jgi:hypothetical protein
LKVREFRTVAAVSALVLSSWALPALADSAAPTADDIKAAGEAFDQGKRAYKQKSWVEAAEHFEDADGRAPSPVALELAIRSRDKAGQLERATTLAALALTRHPEQTALVKLARDVIKRSAGEYHKVVVHCTPACDLVVGTKLVHGKAATERTLYLAPGSAELHAGWSGGRARTSSVDALKGGSSEVSFEAPPEPKPEEPKATPAATPSVGHSAASPGPKPEPQHDQAEPAHGWSPAVFFVGAGLTLAAGGATVWSGIDTRNNPGKDKVRRDCAGQGESCPTYQQGLSHERRTNVLIGVTAGLGVTTIVIGAFLTDWSGGKAKAARAGVHPFVGLGSVGAEGRF